MSSAAWLASAVSAANAACGSLGILEDVTHEAFFSSDSHGTPSYSGPLYRKALVQRKQGVVATTGGTEIKHKAIVSFVGPVSVDPRDRITLSDGVTGPLYVPQGGLSDPTTGKPFLRTVYLRA